MPTTVYFLLPVLAAVSWTDWRRRKIPNIILYPAFLLALILGFFTGRIPGILASLAGAGVGFLLLLIPYLLRGISAGDVKLLMVIGSFGGPRFALAAFLAGALAGGIISAGVLFQYHTGKKFNTRKKIPAKTGTKTGTGKIRTLPYGIPLSLGALICLIIGNRFFLIFENWK